MVNTLFSFIKQSITSVINILISGPSRAEKQAIYVEKLQRVEDLRNLRAKIKTAELRQISLDQVTTVDQVAYPHLDLLILQLDRSANALRRDPDNKIWFSRKKPFSNTEQGIIEDALPSPAIIEAAYKSFKLGFNGEDVASIIVRLEKHVDFRPFPDHIYVSSSYGQRPAVNTILYDTAWRQDLDIQSYKVVEYIDSISSSLF